MNASPKSRPRHQGLLTPRETDVVRMLACGLTSAEIADGLFVSRRTVDFHLVNVYSKLEVKNRVGAVLMAERRGLIPTGAFSSLLP